MTLRRTPQDFRVVEVPTSEFIQSLVQTPTREASHAVYELRKTSLSTPEALAFVCRDLPAKAGTIDYAGLKDKHAETTQLISVAATSRKHAEQLPESISLERCSAKRIGWSKLPMTAEAIEGNRFELIVRDLQNADIRSMRERAESLMRDDAFHVINYFGDQRFGSIRHGQGFAALALIKGDFETAIRLLIGTPARKDVGKTREFTRRCANQWGNWEQLANSLPRIPERRAIEALARGATAKDAFAQLPYFLQTMAVEAFQSHIWNSTVRHMVQDLTQQGVTISKTDGLFDTNLFPAARGIPDSWMTLQIPVLAHNSTLDEPWSAAAVSALSADDLTVKDLKIPGLRRPFFGEALRPMVVRVRDFQLSSAAPDELSKDSKRLKIRSTFTLPRGAYATVVMRALGR